MNDQETISPEISVQRLDYGHEIVVAPLTREGLRRIGPFMQREVALIWAKAMAAERERRRLR